MITKNAAAVTSLKVSRGSNMKNIEAVGVSWWRLSVELCQLHRNEKNDVERERVQHSSVGLENNADRGIG